MDDNSIDTGNFSKITILPDGRMYVFGLTQPLLDLLGDVPTREECWRELAMKLRTEAAPTESEGEIL